MPKILKDKSERLDSRVTFNLNAADYKRLVEIAGKRRVPFGQILRELVRNYLILVSK